MNRRREKRLNCRWLGRPGAAGQAIPGAGAYLLAILFGIVLLLHPARAATAQDGPSRLIITHTDDGTLPTIRLGLFALDGQGRPLELVHDDLTLTAAGLPIRLFEFADRQTGTFTLVIIDVSLEVSDAIQMSKAALSRFASESYMRERQDHLAVAQVTATGLQYLLEPTSDRAAITEFLASPMEAQRGPTALLDSVAGALADFDALRPNSELVSSLVLVTDGTDVVSVQYEADGLIALADGQGLTIHTARVFNPYLKTETLVMGQRLLESLSTATAGLAVTISSAADLDAIWDRSLSFGEQNEVQFVIGDLSAGQHKVTVALADQPRVFAETTIDIPGNLPSVAFVIDDDVQVVNLPDPEQGVEISLAANVRWLDEVERSITSAELLVNGRAVKFIDPLDLGRFNVVIPSLHFGLNQVQVSVTDNQGLQSISPPLTLVVTEGDLAIPAAIRLSWIDRLPLESLKKWLPAAAIVIGLLILLAVVFAVLRRRSGQPVRDSATVKRRTPWRSSSREPAQSERPRRSRRWRKRAKTVAATAPEPVSDAGPSVPDQLSGKTYLEIIESITRTPPQLAILTRQCNLGRSEAESDIVFANDITVAPLHAVISFHAGIFTIRDSGSQTGTLVNGQLVGSDPYTIEDGDAIELGDVRLCFRQI